MSLYYCVCDLEILMLRLLKEHKFLQMCHMEGLRGVFAHVSAVKVRVFTLKFDGEGGIRWARTPLTDVGHIYAQ